MEQAKILLLIKKIQATTGLGMTECLRALKAADYNLKNVMDKLKKEGILKAAKKFTKLTECTAGRVVYLKTNDWVALLKIGCETDYVSETTEFKQLCHDISIHIQSNPSLTTLSMIEDSVINEDSFNNFLLLASGRFREKIKLLDFQFETVSMFEFTSHYIHNNHVGVIAIGQSLTDNISAEQKDLLHKITLHICATKPLFCTSDEVPTAYLNQLKMDLIAKLKSELPKKTAKIYNQIVQGKMKKALGQHVLVQQNAVFNPHNTIGTLAKEAKIKISRYLIVSIAKQ